MQTADVKNALEYIVFYTSCTGVHIVFCTSATHPWRTAIINSISGISTEKGEILRYRIFSPFIWNLANVRSYALQEKIEFMCLFYFP